MVCASATQDEPYENITWIEALHHLRDALRTDTRRKITREMAQTHIDETSWQTNWEWQITTPEWTVLVNHANGCYDNDDSSDEDVRPQAAIARTRRLVRDPATSQQRQRGLMPGGLRVERNTPTNDPFTRSGRAAPRYIVQQRGAAPRYVDYERARHQEHGDVPYENTRQVARRRLEQETEAAARNALNQVHGERWPHWADRALQALDNPQPQGWRPFAGQARRLSDDNQGNRDSNW